MSIKYTNNTNQNIFVGADPGWTIPAGIGNFLILSTKVTTADLILQTKGSISIEKLVGGDNDDTAVQVDDISGGGGGGGGDATAANQVITNDRLQQLLEALGTPETKYKIAVDEVNNNLTYVGYAMPGTATSATSWVISKYAKSGSVTLETIATGVSWDGRGAATYA